MSTMFLLTANRLARHALVGLVIAAAMPASAQTLPCTAEHAAIGFPGPDALYPLLGGMATINDSLGCLLPSSRILDTGSLTNLNKLWLPDYGPGYDAFFWGSSLLVQGGLINALGAVLTNEGSIRVGLPLSMAVFNSSNLSFQNDGVVINNGQILMAGFGGAFSNSGQIVNQSGATLEILFEPLTAQVSWAGGQVSNAGVLRISQELFFGDRATHGQFDLLPGSTLEAASVIVQGSSTQVNAGTLTVWGPFSMYSTLDNQGTLQLKGTSTISYGALLSNSFEMMLGSAPGVWAAPDQPVQLTNYGYLNNDRNLTIKADGLLINGGRDQFGNLSGILQSTDTLTVYGRLENHFQLYNSGSMAVHGEFLNLGRMQNDAGSVLNTGRISNYGTLVNAGDLLSIGALLNGQAGRNDGVLENQNSMTLGDAPGVWARADSQLTNNGLLLNRGTLTVKANALLQSGGDPDSSGITSGHLQNDGNLLVLGQLENWRTLDNTASLVVEGVLRNYGGLHNGGAGTLINRGNFVNTGAVVNDAEFTNTGSVLVLAGSFASNGVLRNAGDGFFSVFAGAQLSGTGDYVQTGGRLFVDGVVNMGGKLRIEGGEVCGRGQILSATFVRAMAVCNVAGVGVPTQARALALAGADAQASALSFAADLTLLDGGVLSFDLAGSAPGSFTRLLIAGRLILEGSGTLRLHFVNDYLPTAGEHWGLLTASNPEALSGLTLSVDGLPEGYGFALDDQGGVAVTSVPVPEPGTAVLMLLGALLAASRRGHCGRAASLAAMGDCLAPR